MKQLLTLVMVILLSGLLATSALAKKELKDYGNKVKTNVTNNAKIEKKRDKSLQKAASIREKRDAKRERVNELMKERLRKIRQNDPGNIGPVGD